MFRFLIGLHIDDLDTLIFIKNQLHCGNINIDKNKSKALLIVTKSDDILNNIIPIFDFFPLNGIKYLDYID